MYSVSSEISGTTPEQQFNFATGSVIDIESILMNCLFRKTVSNTIKCNVSLAAFYVVAVKNDLYPQYGEKRNFVRNLIEIGLLKSNTNAERKSSEICRILKKNGIYDYNITDYSSWEGREAKEFQSRCENMEIHLAKCKANS